MQYVVEDRRWEDGLEDGRCVRVGIHEIFRLRGSHNIVDIKETNIIQQRDGRNVRIEVKKGEMKIYQYHNHKNPNLNLIE